MFTINQGFDLNSPQFNFKRDYFNTLAELKAANEAGFPDHFVTNVNGDLYQLTKTNDVDDTTGRWRKVTLGRDISKSTLGLGNVTNDAQVKRAEMGKASGVATLDTAGKVPASQLPSYVDDVLEATTKADLPKTGETGKIYVTLDTNLTYRWTGTTYVEISQSLALGETSSTAYAGDKGKDTATKLANVRNTALSHISDGNPFTADAASVKLHYQCYANDMYETGVPSSYSSPIPVATTTQAGIVTSADKKNIDNNTSSISAIKSGDLPLVNPSIVPSGSNNSLWTVKKEDGTAVSSITSTGNLSLLYGYKVDFNGCLLWTAKSGYKNPTAVGSGDFSSVSLPTSGTKSTVITSSNITSDKTITATIKAPKQGLVNSNGIIKWASASDIDQASASVKVSFTYKVVHSGFTAVLDAAALKAFMADSTHYTIRSNKNWTLTGVTTTADQYFVYAYPQILGDLTKITLNDATPLLQDGFTKSVLAVTDPDTGHVTHYNVYTSVQKGAFTNAKLDIA